MAKELFAFVLFASVFTADGAVLNGSGSDLWWSIRVILGTILGFVCGYGTAIFIRIHTLGGAMCPSEYEAALTGMTGALTLACGALGALATSGSGWKWGLVILGTVATQFSCFFISLDAL